MRPLWYGKVLIKRAPLSPNRIERHLLLELTPLFTPSIKLAKSQTPRPQFAEQIIPDRPVVDPYTIALHHFDPPDRNQVIGNSEWQGERGDDGDSVLSI